ncbi:MAG: hypothetical protein J6Y02_01180 [Pseudobutyrivibrio sp.]|nr:hypothetical protein [Pseudobutyrivibrio sp.]
MGDEVLNAIEQQILDLTEDLNNYSPESEEYKSRIEEIQTLSNVANNGRKIAADYDNKSTELDRNLKVKEAEIELKKNELEFKKQEHEEKMINDDKARKSNMRCELVKGGVQVFGVTVPLWFYAWFLKQGYNFEKTGIVSSNTFRNFLRCIRPKK